MERVGMSKAKGGYNAEHVSGDYVLHARVIQDTAESDSADKSHNDDLLYTSVSTSIFFRFQYRVNWKLALPETENTKHC